MYSRFFAYFFGPQNTYGRIRPLKVASAVVPQSFLLLGRKISMFFGRNVFGHYRVDRNYLRLLFELYQGSTRPTKVSTSPVLS